MLKYNTKSFILSVQNAIIGHYISKTDSKSQKQKKKKKKVSLDSLIQLILKGQRQNIIYTMVEEISYGRHTVQHHLTTSKAVTFMCLLEFMY